MVVNKLNFLVLYLKLCMTKLVNNSTFQILHITLFIRNKLK